MMSINDRQQAALEQQRQREEQLRQQEQRRQQEQEQRLLQEEQLRQREQDRWENPSTDDCGFWSRWFGRRPTQAAATNKTLRGRPAARPRRR